MEYGIDPSVGMLRVARGRGVEVVAGFSEHPPFRPSSFNSVALIVTLCFVDDPPLAIKSLATLLTCGGVMAACIVPRDSPWGSYYMGLKTSPFYKVARFFTVREVEELMEGAGLEVSGCVSTLRTYGPTDKPRYEHPVEECSGGFVCVKAVKRCCEGVGQRVPGSR